MKLKIVLFSLLLSVNSEKISSQKFPNDFLFGVATSSYQIEGAWNTDGKTENVWDRWTHEHPEFILDGSNGDIASNSYYKVKEDVSLLKQLGVNFYRFSISWSRILPAGFSYKVNQAGIDYYNSLIDELLANGITPMVTMFHWDLPQSLSDLGGFVNEYLVTWFEDYARILFEHFGDRVKIWLTFNEVSVICSESYGSGSLAPGIRAPGIAEYSCTHNILKAHARAYHLYQNHFKAIQQGRVGMTSDCQWYEAASNSSDDIEAAQRNLEFSCGRFLHSIFTKNGDYSDVLKKRVKDRSMQEGFSKSRLPKFTRQEIEMIKGSADFVGLNHYTTFLVRNREEDAIGDSSMHKDIRTTDWQDPTWESGAMDILKTVPWGLRKVLKWIKDNYEEVDIIVTENGYGDTEPLNDENRINFHMLYLSNVLDAIHADGVRVKGYALWSLLDSFEWTYGFTMGFGLYHVNFSDPNRHRTPKASSKFYTRLIKDRILPLPRDEL